MNQPSLFTPTVQEGDWVQVDDKFARTFGLTEGYVTDVLPDGLLLAYGPKECTAQDCRHIIGGIVVPHPIGHVREHWRQCQEGSWQKVTL